MLPTAPSRRPTAADAARKPLLGFGWAGYALLPVLIALLVVVVTGYDLRYQIQKLVLEWFGLDTLFDFTIYVILGSGMGAGSWPPAPRFGPVAISIVLLALHIHPRRVGMVRTVALINFGLAGPALMLWTAWEPLKAWSRAGGPGWEVANTGSCVVATALLWWCSRSWRVAAVCGAILGLPVAGLWVVRYDTSGTISPGLTRAFQYEQWVIGIPMHIALGAILLAWAIKARRNLTPPYACAACGYDLRGITPPCPECGSTPPAPAPHAVDLPGRALDAAPSPHGAQRDQEHDRIR